MECKIVIPSMGRAERILTKKVVDCIICVPESQLNEYKEHSPECEIITHSDNIKGLSLKRQWIYNHFGNVFMLDDDIVSFNSVFDIKNPSKNKSETYDIVQMVFNNAVNSCCYLFGFTKDPNPLRFNGFAPIKMSGYVNGCALGLIKGSKLQFESQSVAVEDYYISGLNAHFHRKAYIDNRFVFVQKDTMVNAGGLSNYRNEETEMNDTLFLRKMFGDCIHIKKENYTSIRKGAKNSHSKNKYARSLILPF